MFSGVFEDFFNKHGTIIMMSAKIAFPVLFKIKFFWNIVYDVIISVHNVANKTLSDDSNYVVDMVLRPKFGNSNSSVREVIIISIL